MADQTTTNEQREFHCSHCDGKIRVPWDLPPTTGPCPHCSEVITSPALVQAPASEFPASTATSDPEPEPPAAVIAAMPQPPAATILPISKPSTEAPPANDRHIPPYRPTPADPAVPSQTVAKNVTPSAVPAAEEPAITPSPALKAAPEFPTAAKSANRRKSKPTNSQRSGLITLMVVLLVLALIISGIVYFLAQGLSTNISPPTVEVSPQASAATEANYLRVGWQTDASKILEGFMSATTVKDKLPFVLNAEQVAPEMVTFYGKEAIQDSDTPASGFSVYELSEEDRERGLFMMIYDQPPQFDLKEFFRPLASMEVQYGVDEPSLLLNTLSRVDNFALEPLRVWAFFKRTAKGLKLDWETFAQTKYRTFLNFVDLPQPGQTGTFRVFIEETVPEKGRAVAGTRSYRLADPANSTTDTARINVKVDSDTGRAISSLNWRGTPENEAITRTATVELKWAGEADAPELTLNRFICWEFLGLGGDSSPAPAPDKADTK